MDINYNNLDTISIVKKKGYRRVVSDLPTFMKKEKDTTKTVTFGINTNTIRNIDWFIKVDSISVPIVKKFLRRKRLRLISPFQFYNDNNKPEGFSLITVRNYDNNIFFINCSKSKVSEDKTENILSIGYYRPLRGLELEQSISLRKKWENN